MLYGGILVAGGGLKSWEPKCGRKVTRYRRKWKGIRKPTNSIPSFHRWGDWALNALPEVMQLISGGVRSLIPVQDFPSISWRQTTEFCLKWHALRSPHHESERDWWGGWSSLFGGRKYLFLRLHSHPLRNVWVNASLWSLWTVSVETGRDPKVEFFYTVVLWRQTELINWTQSPDWGHSQNDFAAEHVVPDED